MTCSTQTKVRRRVLHIGKFYPPHPGGMETHLQSMCNALKPWFDCEVIVANENHRSQVDIIDGIPVTRLGVWFNIAGAPACPAMPRAIARSRADLVHMQWPNPAAFLAYLLSGHRGPLIVSWQSDVIRQRVLNWLFTPVTRAVLRRAALIFASSPDYAANSSMLREFADRVRIVPIGISEENLGRTDSTGVAAIRSRYGSRIVLSVGRLVYYKGFEFLIRAAKSVDAVVLIIGEGQLKRQLERKSIEQGVADHVYLLGEVKDIVSYYQACDIFVLPSIARSEAFGIVQLEAMACEKPVINTRLSSGVPYVSLDDVTGITVPPADAQALADAINKLLADPELRAAYGRAGLQRVRQEFTVGRMAMRIRDLYEEALGVTSRNLGSSSEDLKVLPINQP